MTLAKRFLDASEPRAKRVEHLLEQMTLEEKVGQLNAPIPFPPFVVEATGVNHVSTPQQLEAFTEGTHERGLGPGAGLYGVAGGFFGLPPVHARRGVREATLLNNELQVVARDRTRLGIPLLQVSWGTHGVMVPGATIFPEGPALGSTWNPDLIRDVYAAVAREARAMGIHALATLVIEPIRDPRLGRDCEAYTEDPHLAASIASAIVQGVQGDDVAAPDRAVAVLCHFPGQSQPAGGLEYGAMDVSERALREVFLPPWVAGVARGALGVMATYPSIDGVPAHASHELLTDLLRTELGFDGVVFSEGNGFDSLVWEGVAADQADAGAQALRAGVDLSVTHEDAYVRLGESVTAGDAPIEAVDQAVRRVLDLKFRLGLFEDSLVDAGAAERTVHSAAHQDLALQAAREGVVLLKNDAATLPLAPDLASIAVLGPNAHAPVNQLGNYTNDDLLHPITTVLDGIRGIVGPGTRVDHVPGCSVRGTDTAGFTDAVSAAAEAAVAVVVVGDQQGSLFVEDPVALSTVGERADSATLQLPGVQEELIRAVHATGTPTVVVLVNGRALATPWTADRVPAIVEAWFPGEHGGRAVAEVLFGAHNPTGKLPVTIPRHAGQLPITYDAKPSRSYWVNNPQNPHGGYVDLPGGPLFPFGHGLSYTTFGYSDLAVTAVTGSGTDLALVTARVTNTGPVNGVEVVQLYVNDEVSSVATPEKRLRGFRRVELEPGQGVDVAFTLGFDDLSLLDRDLRPVVEPGRFAVQLGSSSADIRLHGFLDVPSGDGEVL